jgi:hypothetical protein
MGFNKWGSKNHQFPRQILRYLGEGFFMRGSYCVLRIESCVLSIEY